MNAMCPVSFEKINEHATRITAVLTVLTLLLFLFSPWKWIILIITADFYLRGFGKREYSPFARISKIILAALKSKAVMIDAAPKIFAARLGFIFSCMLVACWVLNLSVAALIIGLMFAAFAFLEAAFRFCVACKMYPLVCKL